ncbi:MAG: hypothetical protein Q9195_005485 [Heterodermia aff. obscurata]
MAETATGPGDSKALDAELTSEKTAVSSETATEQTTSQQKVTGSEDSAQQLEPQSKENPTKPDSSAVDDSKPKMPSKNVQEGRAWNNRDRGRGGRGRGSRGDYPRTSFKHNIKSDLTTQEESNDPVAIRKQVEFYFSDSNLYSDKFLFERLGGHQNLPVPISIIHSFKRMQHFQPLSAVVAALKDSTTLDVVDNDSCLQRKYPLSVDLKDKPMVEIQKVYEDKAMAKSIYAKGFGEEEPGTQFDVEAFFSEFGTTNSVRLRRTPQRSFKGSVFVEFDSEETQKNFLELDPKPKWKGKELLIKSKKQYCDDKVDDIQAGKVRPRSPDDNSFRGKQGHKHHGSDELDWKTRREKDQANGFQDKRDRRGNRRGFGSSGQRGRGDRDRDRRGQKVDRNEEKRNDHSNAKAPTIESTSQVSTKVPDAETPNKATSSTIDAPVTDTAVAGKTTTDATESKVDQAEPNTTAAAHPSPSQESKKRPLETDDDNALEEKAVKVQKTEIDSEPATSAPAPSTEESKKRPRDDDDGATNEDKQAKLQKITAAEES